MKKEISKPEPKEKQAIIEEPVPQMEPETVETPEQVKPIVIATPAIEPNAELKLRQSYLKRQLQSKSEQISRNEKKVEEWLKTGGEMLSTAKLNFEKTKQDLETKIENLTLRYETKSAKVQKNWIDWTHNFVDTKLKSQKDDYEKIQTELITIEEKLK